MDEAEAVNTLQCQRQLGDVETGKRYLENLLFDQKGHHVTTCKANPNMRNKLTNGHKEHERD